jgi:hypothetical protein
LLKAKKKRSVILSNCVAPEYQSKGVNSAIIFEEYYKTFYLQKSGIIDCIRTPELGQTDSSTMETF